MWIVTVLKVIVGGSWKTTVAGFAAAVATVLLPILQNGMMPTAQEWLLAICLAVLGRCGKDFNATGGTQITGPIQPSQMAKDNKTTLDQAGFDRASETRPGTGGHA